MSCPTCTDGSGHRVSKALLAAVRADTSHRQIAEVVSSTGGVRLRLESGNQVQLWHHHDLSAILPVGTIVLFDEHYQVMLSGRIFSVEPVSELHPAQV